MTWQVIATSPFLKTLRRHGKDSSLKAALDRKIRRLRENPDAVGGQLSGELSGYRSTRLIGKFRLLFEIVPPKSTVYLHALDHRKFGYSRFRVP